MCGQVAELDLDRLVARVVGVQENLGEIEKSVARVQLRAERTGVVAEHFIFDASSVFGTADFPAAGVQLSDGQRATALTFGVGAKPIHILREITYLIEGVPDGEMELMSIAAGRNFKRDLHEMALRIGERNDVANGRLSEAELAEENKDEQ